MSLIFINFSLVLSPRVLVVVPSPASGTSRRILMSVFAALRLSHTFQSADIIGVLLQIGLRQVVNVIIRSNGDDVVELLVVVVRIVQRPFARPFVKRRRRL